MRRKPRFLALPALVLIIGLAALPLPSQADLSPSRSPIRLQFATFDPLSGEPDLPPTLQSTDPGREPTTWLVQFRGPVQEAWKGAVEQAGAHLYGYVPDYAFIARMDAAAAEKVRALPHVRWVGLYHPAYRLSPELSALAEAGKGAEALTLTIQTLPDADLDALAQTLAGLGGQVSATWTNSLGGFLRAQLPGQALAVAARLDEVLWIEPYRQPELFNDVGGGQIMGADDIRTDLGLYGSGQTVAVCDTGLDTGDEATLSADFKPQFVKAYALGRSILNDWSDDNSHGTHVAGSVLGNGQLSGSNPSAHDYSGSFAGVAPEASLIFQSVLDALGGLGGIPSDYDDLFGPPYNDGARIHTNSWGAPVAGIYTNESSMVDDFTWNHPDMLVLYAAGNEGTDGNSDGVVDPDSMGSPGTAKNALTVGASENLRASIATTWGDGWPSDYPVDPINSDRIADDAEGMAAFSSRGPTDDGRIKPDITAPGTYIISARSHDPRAGTGWGIYDANYLYMGGTSMATPLTAGAAALVREWLTEQQGVSSPSGALMKAVLINGAADMAPGQYGTGSTREIPALRPNPVNGWGRVDLVESLDPPVPRQVWFEDHTGGLSTGGSVQYRLTVGTSQAASPPPPPVSAVAAPASEGPSRPVHRLRTLTPAQAPAFVGAASRHRPLGTTQLLQNEGFETGAWSPWQTYGSPYLTNIIRHGGNWSAHGGNANNADDQFWQQVDIPADATDVTLDFWYRLRTDETYADYDYFCYGIWNQGGDTAYVLRCADFGDTGDVYWTEEVHSLNAGELGDVVGQTVLFGFYVQTDSSLTSRAWVDDTALYVTTGGGSTPTLTITPESGPRGTAFTVTGSGFNADDTVTIAIDGVDQFTVTSDGSGGFSFNLTPPGTETKGVHTVTATDTDSHSASDTYEIVPQVSVEVSPSAGDPGASFTVSGSGFHGGSAITVKLDGAPDGTTTADNDGDFSYTLETDSSIAAGSHTVSATDDESSTGSDTLTINEGSSGGDEALTDGGFEQATGDTSHPTWNVSGNARFTVNQGIAHTGQDAAILGYTSSPATGDLWQAVAVPADASSAALTFWYQSLGDGSFTASVDVTDSSGGTVLVHLADLNSAGFAWQQFSHDFTAGELAAIAGRNVRLRFRISAVTDPEDLVIDDVSWQVAANGGSTTGGPFRVTLVWTDYPGQPAAAKALVNDLDLEVIAPDGTHYYGNQGVYTSGQCLRDGQWDACNNVEGVIIPAALYGTYTVIVHGANVAQGTQPFAIVASGDNLREGQSVTYDHAVYLPLVVKH